MDKPLSRKKRDDKLYIVEKKVIIPTSSPDVDRMVRKYYEQIFASDFFKLEKMGTCMKDTNCKPDSKSINCGSSMCI